MKILNPLYDNAFKYLMEDNNIAKTILSIILDTNILALQAKPQETVLHNGLFRFDYKAVIQEKNGEEKTVLVEVQKYNSPNPVKRFRGYLGTNYARTETVKTANGEIEMILPLVSIYILGYDLPEFDCRIIRVDNTPYDIVAQKIIDVKSKFVEQLTHKCYILIAQNEDNTAKTTLVEQLLDLFIQKLRGEKSNPVIEIAEDVYNNELIPIIERLKRATLDGELLRKVQLEQDFIDNETSKDQLLGEALKREEEAKQRVEEAKQREQAAKQREEEERRQKEEAKLREKQAKQKFAKKLIAYGESIENIISETGLTESEIKELF